MIVVYSHIVSNRLSYTLDVIFNYVLNVKYKIVDVETFKIHTSHAKLNYSDLDIENCISINPHKLLFEEEIKNPVLNVDWNNNLPYFFKTSENATFKYDILASVFYLISRYEEYIPSELDIHDRFQAENSIAYQNNFLEIPIVNHWAIKLKNELLLKFPDTKFPIKKFKHKDTFDIDIAYTYKGKNKFRLLLSTILSILKFDRKEINNRYNYFIKKEKDLYDIYNKLSTNKIYFFQIGDYGKYDKNISHSSSAMKNLINTLNQKNEIGIHPSYKSNNNLKILTKEKKRLESISKETVVKSRQHFLKLSIPKTYKNLILTGIKEDYTMGYASKVGFRAGICSPFPFFNLEKNEKTELIIFPFQIMDGTLNEYLKLTPSEAIEKINKIINEIQTVNGTFISLWHNSSLSEQKHWKGWTIVYEKLLDLTTRKKIEE